MNEREKKYWKEVKEIENSYKDFIGKFPLMFPKPLNLQEERFKFFKALVDDEVYNPQIKYGKKLITEEDINELKNLKISTRNDMYGFKKLYKEKIKAKIIQLHYHMYWGSERSNKYILKYWGKPSYFLFRKAFKFCKNFERQKVKFKTIDVKDAGKRLKEEVKILTGDTIKLSYVNIQAKVNIDPSMNLIQLNPYERFTTLDIRRLKVHEIGTHYMRYFNGRNMGIDILEKGTADYMKTEEGLATYSEYLKGVSSKAQMFIYAGRVIATYYAPKKSFYKIFTILKDLKFRDSAAFAITYRAKRSLSDTSLPGGFTKDYVYFSGFYKVEKFAKKNDIKDLFIGKIGIGDVKRLKKFIKLNKHKIVTIFDKKEDE